VLENPKPALPTPWQPPRCGLVGATRNQCATPPRRAAVEPYHLLVQTGTGPTPPNNPSDASPTRPLVGVSRRGKPAESSARRLPQRSPPAGARQAVTLPPRHRTANRSSCSRDPCQTAPRSLCQAEPNARQPGASRRSTAAGEPSSHTRANSPASRSPLPSHA